MCKNVIFSPIVEGTEINIQNSFTVSEISVGYTRFLDIMCKIDFRELGNRVAYYHNMVYTVVNVNAR